MGKPASEKPAPENDQESATSHYHTIIDAIVKDSFPGNDQQSNQKIPDYIGHDMTDVEGDDSCGAVLQGQKKVRQAESRPPQTPVGIGNAGSESGYERPDPGSSLLLEIQVQPAVSYIDHHPQTHPDQESAAGE